MGVVINPTNYLDTLVKQKIDFEFKCKSCWKERGETIAALEKFK